MRHLEYVAQHQDLESVLVREVSGLRPRVQGRRLARRLPLCQLCEKVRSLDEVERVERAIRRVCVEGNVADLVLYSAVLLVSVNSLYVSKSTSNARAAIDLDKPAGQSRHQTVDSPNIRSKDSHSRSFADHLAASKKREVISEVGMKDSVMEEVRQATMFRKNTCSSKKRRKENASLGARSAKASTPPCSFRNLDITCSPLRYSGRSPTIICTSANVETAHTHCRDNA